MGNAGSNRKARLMFRDLEQLYAALRRRAFIARLHALTARRGPSQRFRVGCLEIDQTARRMTIGGREAFLPPLEFNILCVLAREPTVIATTDLAAAVWGQSAERNRDVLYSRIRSLRRRLRTQGVQITTEASGYRLSVSEE